MYARIMHVTAIEVYEDVVATFAIEVDHTVRVGSFRACNLAINHA
jgi:hypothetical protein